MAAKTKRKILKHKAAKKAPAKQKAARKGNVYDLEELLIEKVIGSKALGTNGTDIENLIYSTTTKTSKLGYSFGFSVGRAMALKLAGNVSVDVVLDRIGLHKSIYQPLGDVISITSTPPKSEQTRNIGRQVHVYESGVIAGYLSATTGVKISAIERMCVYDGSGSCQFYASQSIYPRFASGNLNDTVAGIADTIMNGQFTNIPEEYYKALAYLPLVDSRIAEQVMQIMIMSGERMGSMGASKKAQKLVDNIARYFGASSVKMERKGRKSIIKLRYASYNSIRAFVAMPAALITGLYNSMGRSAQVSFSTNRDGSYTTTIEIDKKI